MTTSPPPLVLSADEIGAAARLAGRSPLPTFVAGWAPEEATVAEAVALRSLLARGLVTVEQVATGPTLTLTVDSLAPLLCPEAVVETVSEGPDGSRQRWLVGETKRRLILAEEHHPMVWQLTSGAGTAERYGDALLGRMVTTADPVPVTGADESDAPLRVATRVLARARTRFATGGGETLDAWLRAQGLPGADAERLTLLLGSNPTTVTVRTARSRGGELHEAGSVTWLATDRAGLWLVDPTEGPDDAEGHSLLRSVSPAMLRAAVTDLLGLTDDPGGE